MRGVTKGALVCAGVPEAGVPGRCSAGPAHDPVLLHHLQVASLLLDTYTLCATVTDAACHRKTRLALPATVQLLCSENSGCYFTIYVASSWCSLC